MGAHSAGRRPRGKRWGAKRFLIPAVAGVVTFGAVTAFAATLSVSSNKLSAGNTTVANCNAAAQVSYATAYASSIPGYAVSTATITTASTCAGMAYKVTLSGAGNTSLGEQTGTLDGTGGATTPAFSPTVSAALVTGVAVTITG
jgi:hypothetical protein